MSHYWRKKQTKKTRKTEGARKQQRERKGKSRYLAAGQLGAMTQAFLYHGLRLSLFGSLQSPSTWAKSLRQNLNLSGWGMAASSLTDPQQTQTGAGLGEKSEQQMVNGSKVLLIWRWEKPDLHCKAEVWERSHFTCKRPRHLKEMRFFAKISHSVLW